MTTPRNYARVYYEIVDHPRFERVYQNPSALGVWLQLLLTADAMYPMNPPMPSRNPTVRLLIASGLVIEKPGNRYSIRGLEAERERRSAVGRNASRVRHGSERNASGVPSKAEQRTDEKIGADAHIPGTFLGFRPKVDANAADVKRQQDQLWNNCAKCGVQGRKHPAGGDHQFEVAA
jgi:hypothetical protein